ncbi:MAG: CopG family transcriptional regulator [Duncaniella sp.]|nr:CopG family transcriptional regulator [Duncaniella sp.]
MAHTISVEITWSDKNFCCGWGLEDVGAIFCTNKSLEGLKTEFEESLRFHVETMAEDGEAVPEWLLAGDYDIEYKLSVAALLRQAETFTTMAVISRFTGINQKLLSHYASALKIPRAAQREKIVNGIHEIGQQILAVH